MSTEYEQQYKEVKGTGLVNELAKIILRYQKEGNPKKAEALVSEPPLSQVNEILRALEEAEAAKAQAEVNKIHSDAS